MGCRILVERRDGRAVLYCSTTQWAFGPLFRNEEQAERFLVWLRDTPNQFQTLLGLPKSDPRSYPESVLETLYSKFRMGDTETLYE